MGLNKKSELLVQYLYLENNVTNISTYGQDLIKIPNKMAEGSEIDSFNFLHWILFFSTLLQRVGMKFWKKMGETKVMENSYWIRRA